LICAAIAAASVASAESQRPIADQHPPARLNPQEREGPRLSFVTEERWAFVEWREKCVDDACTATVVGPVGFVSGDFGPEGYALFQAMFFESLFGFEYEPEAALSPGQITALKKACAKGCTEGCCPGWAPPAPACSDFCGYAFEAVNGGSSCQCCLCVYDNGGTCSGACPSWGGPNKDVSGGGTY